ncbi:uncharacterized protein V2V93DRAFT_318701, partial [Kockiozyma suomiensis]|uniref:uncharacterized protein n=1 Tax=Kockiozyma suomiensis TaxID=1337062 RepID=UPI003343C901
TSRETPALPSAQADDLQLLFYKKYGLKPSINYWVEPVYTAICLTSGIDHAQSTNAIFAKLEPAFLNEDLRKCIPPLPAQSGQKQSLPMHLIDIPPGEAEADLLKTIQSSNLLPDISSASSTTTTTTQAITITAPTTFQIVDVLEIGISKYEQLRRLEDGMTDGGRKIVRDLPPTDSDNDFTTSNEQTLELPQSSNAAVQYHIFETNGKPKPLIGKSTCKLLLQDALGRLFWAIELKPIPNIQVGLKLGCKITVAADTLCLRGVIMLKPTGTILHGGVIEEWNVRFRMEFMSKLKRDLGITDESAP